MEAAAHLDGRGATVVCLVRFVPTTDWFQRYVDGVASEVRMLNKKLKFRKTKDSYNFPCCVVVYDGLTSETDYYLWGW